MGMKNNQKGFGAVEALLILILLSILGFTGYYVYHTSKDANSSYDNASTSNNATAQKSAVSDKFVFKEIWVQVTLPASLKDLAYTTSTSDGVTYLDLYTPGFEDALHKCDPSTTQSNNSPFISIAKMTGQFNQDNNPEVGNLKQFSDFWISGASPNGIVCADTTSQSDKDNFQSMFTDSITATRDAFKTATLVK